MSDVDLLLLHTGQSRITFEQSCAGLKLDVHGYPVHTVHTQLDKSNWRNNIPMLALANGILLPESSIEVHQLVLFAKRLWQQGTGSLNRAEAKELLLASQGVEHAAKKFRLRTMQRTDDPQAHGLLLAQLYTHYSSAVILYQRCHAVWAYVPWVVSALSGPCYEVLASCNRLAFSELDRTAAMADRIVWLCQQARERLLACDRLEG